MALLNTAPDRALQQLTEIRTKFEEAFVAGIENFIVMKRNEDKMIFNYSLSH